MLECGGAEQQQQQQQQSGSGVPSEGVCSHGRVGILGRLGRKKEDTASSDAEDGQGPRGQDGPEFSDPSGAEARGSGALEGILHHGILQRFSRGRVSSYTKATETLEKEQLDDEDRATHRSPNAPGSLAAAPPPSSKSCSPSPARLSPLCTTALRSPAVRHATAVSDSSRSTPLPGSSSCEWGSPELSYGESFKEHIVRLRPFIQPQQGKRRQRGQAASAACSVAPDSFASKDTQQHENVAAQSTLPTGTRHSRKQPCQHSQSQSSSSGYQPSVSDSDGGSVAKCGTYPCMGFRIADAQEPQSNSGPSVCLGCGLTYTADSLFCRGCGRKRPEIPAGTANSAMVAAAGLSGTLSAAEARPYPVAPTLKSGACTFADDEDPLWRSRQGVSPRCREGESTACMPDATSLPTRSPPLEQVMSDFLGVCNPMWHFDSLGGAGDTSATIAAIKAGGHTPWGQTPKSCAASPCMHSSVSFDGLSSALPSPFIGGASASQGASPFMRPITPSTNAHTAGTGVSEVASVRILNGVSGEEEARFAIPQQSSFSEQHFLGILDKLCQQRTGQPLSELKWLRQVQAGGQYQRRKCDISMVEEFFRGKGGSKQCSPTLLLCTVPVRPPSELVATKIRLKSIVPAQVFQPACTLGSPGEQPLQVQIDTSPLEQNRDYSVAFTHQWSNMTYTSVATLLASQRGVQAIVPWQMLVASTQNTDGLYDVHLVVDGHFRSENRRALTVASAESDVSSSCVSHAASGAFLPIVAPRTA